MDSGPVATAVVLVAHGSRGSSANQAHLDLADALDARIDPTVIGAFMELAEPSIGDAIGRAVEAGASVVAVLPYFLHPGRHLRDDIPRLVAEAAATRPDVDISLVEHFGADAGVLDLLVGQVGRAFAG
jgi:sirohydrochlorin cobaltochelatase